MLNNEASPSYFNGGTPEQYQDYRYFVLSRLPNLIVLDITPVTKEELEKAKEFYASLKVQPILKTKLEQKKQEEMLKKQREEEAQQKLIEEQKKQKEEEEKRRLEVERQQEQSLTKSNSILLPQAPSLPPVNSKNTSSKASNPIPTPPPLKSILKKQDVETKQNWKEKLPVPSSSSSEEETEPIQRNDSLRNLKLPAVKQDSSDDE